MTWSVTSLSAPCFEVGLMDSRAQPRLPQEIFDTIIDNYPHDEEMLKTFALVSRSFLHQSRRHFFHDIRFCHDDVYYGDAKCRVLQARFWEILNANPDIASYVRDVHIKDNPILSWILAIRDDGDKLRPSWIREEETFQEILLVLAKSSISSLTLDIDLSWTTFPIGLQHALTQIFSAPSLMNLDLSNLSSLPVSSCMHFRRLKQLRISEIFLLEGDRCQRAEAAGAAAVSISSLEVTRLNGRSAQLFCNILGLGKTGTPPAFLKELRISFSDVDFTREVIWAARKSLRYLSLAIRKLSLNFNIMTCSPLGRSGKDTARINFADLKSLNRLDLRVYSQFDTEDYLTGVLGVLETGGPNKKLCEIHIALHFDSYYSCVDHFSQSSWGRLSTTLDRFSSLMHLVVKLVIGRYVGQSYLREEQKAELGRSVRNGLRSGAGNYGSVNKVLRVKISELYPQQPVHVSII